MDLRVGGVGLQLVQMCIRDRLEGFTQERTSAQREYTPPFDLTGVAGEGGAL